MTVLESPTFGVTPGSEVAQPRGVWNRILRVDLGTGRTWEERPGEDFFRKHVGGRGIIAHYLLTEVPSGIDAFDPQNVLVFAAGPVTGVPVPGGGRHSVGAKSPQTGGFGEAESGGFWGAELKHAGWDAVVITGRAASPVYLLIQDDHVEVRGASHLWGSDTGAVEDLIRAELGDKLVRVAQCGIAGERLVRYACVINDLNEAAGRTGMGAVMGSKRLKAIAVRGHKQVPVANNKPLRDVARWVSSTLEDNHRNFHLYGTGAGVVSKSLEGHLPVRNFREGVMPTITNIDAKAIRELPGSSMDGCYACSVRCKKRVSMAVPYAVDPRYGGPEYETLAANGSNVGVDDVAAVCKANELLNRFGLDSISCGATIAWAIECYEQGLLTDAETGGLKLEWGDGALVLRLIEQIAHREGFGDLLAEGSLRAARRIGRGAERYAVQVKGLEIAMHDPRAMAGMLENYPVTPTGGDHMSASKPRASLRNTLGVCQFLAYSDERMEEIVNAVTGWEVTEADLQRVAARGLTMARLFNLREGLGRADDTLPARMFEPLRQGPLSDKRLDPAAVQDVVERYYTHQGWDPVTGIPEAATLESLGIADPAYTQGVPLPA